jgi:hypothetical protein
MSRKEREKTVLRDLHSGKRVWNERQGKKEISEIENVATQNINL